MKTRTLRMKSRLTMAMLLAVVGMGHAEIPPNPAAQREAVQLFPDLAKRDSEFNKRFNEHARALRETRDPILEEDNWPVVVAYHVAKQLAVSPKPGVAPSSTSAMPAATANVRPGTPAPSTPPKDPRVNEFVGTMAVPIYSDLQGKIVAQGEGGVIARVKVKGGSQLVFLRGATGATGMEFSISVTKGGIYHYAPSGLPAKDIESYNVSR